MACTYFSLTSSDNCYEEGMDYEGDDINQIQASNAIECQRSCQNVFACKFWTFLKPLKKCFRKWNKNAILAGLTFIGEVKISAKDFVSGPKFCPGI